MSKNRNYLVVDLCVELWMQRDLSFPLLSLVIPIPLSRHTRPHMFFSRYIFSLCQTPFLPILTLFIGFCRLPFSLPPHTTATHYMTSTPPLDNSQSLKGIAHDIRTACTQPAGSRNTGQDGRCSGAGRPCSCGAARGRRRIIRQRQCCGCEDPQTGPVQ